MLLSIFARLRNNELADTLQNKRLTRTWKICQNQHAGTLLPSQHLPGVTVSLLQLNVLDLSNALKLSESSY